MLQDSNAPAVDALRPDINPLGLKHIDHIEFLVDDVEKWTDYYVNCYGMYKRSFGDESTGLIGRKAYVVGQGRVNFVFAEPQGESDHANEIRAFLKQHGSGVKDVAFKVEDPAVALKNALAAGAELARELDTNEGFTATSIKTYGDVIHTFIKRDNHSKFAPHYENIAGGIEDGDIHFMMIDHIVANVENMNEWVDYYRKVFGFEQRGQFDIKTGNSALMSKVMGDQDGYIKMPINEPSSENSQIQVFLNDFGGPGVQHIALLTDDIVSTIGTMRERGVKFLEVPDTYYEAIPKRVPLMREKLEAIKQYGILADQDRDDGYLLQLFTQPVFERPTLFHEIIQRRGNSDGFGEGNFQALFEAIEREQAKRGLL